MAVELPLALMGKPSIPKDLETRSLVADTTMPEPRRTWGPLIPTTVGSQAHRPELRGSGPAQPASLGGGVRKPPGTFVRTEEGTGSGHCEGGDQDHKASGVRGSPTRERH